MKNEQFLPPGSIPLIESIEHGEHLQWLDKEHNFQLVFISNNDNQTQHNLNDKSGKIIIADKNNAPIVDLKVFSDSKHPEYFTFELFKGKEFDSAGEHGNLVRISEERLKDDARNIFLILHELGHCHVSNMHPEKHSAAFDARQLTLNPIFIPDDLKSMGIDSEKKKELFSNVVENERDAWAQAIKIARKIKSEYGLDLFELFRDSGDFMGWVRNAGLYSYEKQLELFGGGKPTKADLLKKQKLNDLLDDFKETVIALFISAKK